MNFSEYRPLKVIKMESSSYKRGLFIEVATLDGKNETIYFDKESLRKIMKEVIELI